MATLSAASATVHVLNERGFVNFTSAVIGRDRLIVGVDAAIAVTTAPSVTPTPCTDCPIATLPNELKTTLVSRGSNVTALLVSSMATGLDSWTVGCAV